MNLPAASGRDTWWIIYYLFCCKRRRIYPKEIKTTQIYAKVIEQKVSDDMKQLKEKLKIDKNSNIKTVGVTISNQFEIESIPGK